ncbi:MAG: energy-coupling factor transporter transmembrane protein EcfT [Eubacterium sp.]|nr:energy-coupling factor transporter transmembrane protein EcfT [Eubacterium sp.]
MNYFGKFHPTIIMLYYFIAVFLNVYYFDLGVSLVFFMSQIFSYIYYKGVNKGVRFVLKGIILIEIIAVLNSVINGRGMTIFLTVLGQKIMLESYIYGTNLGLILVGTLLLFGGYNELMSSGKIMTVLGKHFPGIAMSFSTVLMFVEKIKWLYGKLRENNHMGIPLINTITALSLEEAVDTGVSMEYRGYGKGGKRTSIYSKDFVKKDIIFALIIVTLSILSIVLYKNSQTHIYIYPYLDMNFDGLGLSTYGLLGGIFILPFIINITKEIKWKFAIKQIRS